jgi:hypothetical protein
MAKTEEELAELLKLVRDEDIFTLRALERQLHSLVEAKERDEAAQRRGGVQRETLAKTCSEASIDRELLSLAGIHPENPVQNDKTLIREAIARRLLD